MVPFLLAGLWVFVRFLRSRSERLVWLAGLFWGGAFLYKYTALFYPVCALAFLGLITVAADRGISRRGTRGLGRVLIMLGCGFGTSLLPVIVYFAAHGALGDLVSASVFYNLKYTGVVSAGNGGLGFALGQAAKWILRNPFLWLGGMAGAVTVAIRSRKERTSAIWLFWLAAAWAAIAANRRYFHYHFIQIVPPLAVLSAYVLDWGITSIGRRKLRALTVPALAACFLLMAPDVRKVQQNLKPDLKVLLKKTTQPEYWARFVTGDFSFLGDLYLAEYLKERTGPEDRIFIFGFEPLVYFLAAREPASRYIFNDPVTAPYVDHEARTRALEEIVTDLGDTQPVYIVVVEGDANPVDPTDSYGFFRNTALLGNLVDEGYLLERQARKFHIYRRSPD
jgi:hypothetical protein